MRLYTILVLLLLIYIIPSFADNSLQRIQSQGVIKICTTGDYPPLTQFQNGRFKGKAINDAKCLAQYLNVKISFVKTTWLTLSHDLASGKCDIAMGGISKTKNRAKQFLLSNPVAKFGKVPLVRCQDKNKFNTFAKIDQPNVRIVENVGGTNEQFAKQSIKHAKLILVKMNKDAFMYLLKHRADVMFTDNIEAIYRQKIMPNLCAIHPNRPYTTNYKVYMLPKESYQLLNIVNKWLKNKKMGTITCTHLQKSNH